MPERRVAIRAGGTTGHEAQAERSTRRRGAVLIGVVALLGLTCAASRGRAEDRDLNQIDYAMYFMSEVKDAPECAMSVENERIVFAPPVTNPVMTCPDMFAWSLFTEVVLDEFWARWPDETQNWPPEPYPLCAAGASPPGCCEPGNPANDPEHCPLFPGGDHPAALELRARPRPLRQSVRAHLRGPHEGTLERQDLVELLAAKPGPGAGALKPCSALELPDDPDSIGRVIRQTNGELTIRNRAFHDYVFQNNLYNADGVIAVFENNARNITSNAPYRRASYPVGGDRRTADLSTIAFPADAVMIKSNWLNVDLMEAMATKYEWQWKDPAHPYIEKEMTQILEDQAGQKYDCSGTHRLLAFHVSSKDIPNWMWATFEHVQLPGRCDYTGCNDSWGYWSSDPEIPGAARNYIAPKVRDDEFPMHADSTVYDRDRVYPSGALRPQLEVVLDALQIGTAPANGTEATPQDAAWRSYRLKGTQVEFVDSMGRPTYLGHSVTEAGFMNGSSCITCHSRAGTDARGPFHQQEKGKPPIPTFPLSVFVNDLSDFGYGKSAHGIPNKAWYHRSNQPPSLEVLQTDFVWGFLFARPTVSAGSR